MFTVCTVSRICIVGYVKYGIQQEQTNLRRSPGTVSACAGSDTGNQPAGPCGGDTRGATPSLTSWAEEPQPLVPIACRSGVAWSSATSLPACLNLSLTGCLELQPCLSVCLAGTYPLGYSTYVRPRRTEDPFLGDDTAHDVRLAECTGTLQNQGSTVDLYGCAGG